MRGAGDNYGKQRGIAHMVRALVWSLKGLLAAVRHEAAFRQELLAVAVLVPAGIVLGKTGTERALLVGCLFVVLVVELLNSALEAVVNRVGLEDHPLSGRAKDLGSAAVFLSICTVAVVWLLILWPMNQVGS